MISGDSRKFRDTWQVCLCHIFSPNVDTINVFLCTVMQLWIYEVVNVDCVCSKAIDYGNKFM